MDSVIAEGNQFIVSYDPFCKTSSKTRINDYAAFELTLNGEVSYGLVKPNNEKKLASAEGSFKNDEISHHGDVSIKVLNGCPIEKEKPAKPTQNLAARNTTTACKKI